jgi:hypothetical protein
MQCSTALCCYGIELASNELVFDELAMHIVTCYVMQDGRDGSCRGQDHVPFRNVLCKARLVQVDWLAMFM